jgi:hypothetical protein
MLNSDLMSGVSIETLGAILASSVLLAECVMCETAAFPIVAQRKDGGVASPGHEADREAALQRWRSVNALRRAELRRSLNLSRCVSRARARYAIRIRGRR